MQFFSQKIVKEFVSYSLPLSDLSLLIFQSKWFSTLALYFKNICSASFLVEKVNLGMPRVVVYKSDIPFLSTFTYCVLKVC